MASAGKQGDSQQSAEQVAAQVAADKYATARDTAAAKEQAAFDTQRALMSQQVPMYYQPMRAQMPQSSATFSMNGQTYFNPFVSNTPAQQTQSPQDRAAALLAQTQQYRQGYTNQIAAVQDQMRAQAQAAAAAAEKKKADEAEAARQKSLAEQLNNPFGSMFGTGGSFAAAQGGLASIEGFKR